MKCRDIQYLLPELADGTLDPGEKARVDAHLAQCEECRMDAALLKETFAALRADVQELPPANYFATLLPKVRARLERKERAGLFLMPAWFEKAAAPMTVFAMGLLVVGLFRAFQPSEEFSPLRSLVEQIPGDDIAAVTVSASDPYSGEIGVPSTESVLETAPDANTVADDMRSELLTDDAPAQQIDAVAQADDKVVNDLDDDTVSEVLERMSEQPTL